jgi:hypothetical protein
MRSPRSIAAYQYAIGSIGINSSPSTPVSSPYLTYNGLFQLLTRIYESFGQAPAPTFANASNGDFWMVFLAAKNPAASGNLFLSW